jgi:osmotically inducible protein OsmC
MPVRNASAVWEGSLKDGKGTMQMASGAYKGAYSYTSRFEEGTGTNPEELVAAAHAGCFSMALSANLGRADYIPERIATTAHLKLEKTDAGFTITAIHLETEAKVPGIDAETFQEQAEAAKANCPVSRALKAVEITLNAKLVS